MAVSNLLVNVSLGDSSPADLTGGNGSVAVVDRDDLVRLLWHRVTDVAEMAFTRTCCASGCGSCGRNPRRRSLATASKGSRMLVQQAANNSKQQVANSPDLSQVLMHTLIDALEIHTTMSTQTRGVRASSRGAAGHVARTGAAVRVIASSQQSSAPVSITERLIEELRQ